MARVPSWLPEPPCTGDVVRLTLDVPLDEPPFVEEVLPRRSLLKRADAGGSSQQQALAANVDVVAVVAAFDPVAKRSVHAGRIERMLTLAWASGAEPVVLLTKADLHPDADEVAASLAARTACTVLPVSSRTGAGLDDVRGLLEGGRVVALLGPSGAGKSSLVNALADAETMAVQEVRGDGKGRHTTVTRELRRVAGGAVIDGPGLRGAGLAGGEADDGSLDRAFADVAALAERCRFADCAHESEPGCAVRGAVAAGSLNPDRLAAWRKLQAESRWQERRRDARLASEDRAAVRALHRGAYKEIRERSRAKNRGRR
ncbi:ribosome small subunit-dependent GTPase A [Spongisporangium articulatum]|uniref:Ribosome small subunit-dependent GTPase A n=1 Tax=Spongisporangium articulatum TaxID=3362603 RepID=A0ABW8AS38_9ACTN